MLDTTPVTSAITRLISTGTTEQALLAAVAHLRGNGGGSDRTRRRDCSFGSSHQLAWEPGNRALARCRRSTRRAQECVPWRNSLSPMPTALGVPLFERHRDGIRLTAAWWQFLACIERREAQTDRRSLPRWSGPESCILRTRHGDRKDRVRTAGLVTGQTTSALQGDCLL